MAVFQVETKNKVDIDKKAKVYFTCHPDDFEKYFKKVCDDIFRTHDCAIYYTEDMTEVIDDDEKETDLGRNNLFVIPVTFKLLTTPNRAMDEDIPYALKEHIPVLPIMMESEIDEFYSKPDKFGELQYLNPYSTDLTEISYEEKIKKYLESVLISDELAKRVRAAFDAYIFLSYRKKDRKYANELMRLIHSNPECRDIAIWFDEFLTPGESFKENIEKILDDCKLFTLLVTPQLLEKVVDENGKERDNYVISTELPLARKKKEEKGTDIFAVEMEDTDKEALSAISIEDYVNSGDSKFRSRLLESVSKIAIKENNTPEHNFLIGLAYLEGIDVEVDRKRALELIISAAESDLPEAMKKLYKMYGEGLGAQLNYRKAVIWAEKLAEYNVKQFGEEHPDTLTSLGNLSVTYSKLGDYRKALELKEKVYNLRCKILGEEHPDTLISLSNLAMGYSDIDDYKKALEFGEKVYELRCKILGEEHPGTLLSINNLSGFYGKHGDYKKALKLDEKAYELRCKALGEEHPDTLTSLGNLSVTYSELGDYRKALELKEKVYNLRCKSLGEGHPYTLISLSNLAMGYNDIGDYKKALELDEKVYELRCKSLGEGHPDTLISFNNLAMGYNDIGDYKKALELGEKSYELHYEVLGECHSATLMSLNNLAMIYGNLRNYRRALELYEKVYVRKCEILGAEHPDTLISLSNLATAYSNLDDDKKALELTEKAYKLRCKVLGEEHPDTLLSLNNLAVIYSHLGDYEKALEIKEKVYVLCRKNLGTEHPDTLLYLSNLAIAYSALDNDKKALELAGKAYELYCKALGTEHPDTIASLSDYAWANLCEGKLFTGLKLLLKHHFLKKKCK